MFHVEHISALKMPDYIVHAVPEAGVALHFIGYDVDRMDDRGVFSV